MNTTRESTATTRDTLRQVVVLATMVVAIVGAMIGSGLFGGDSMPEAAGGAFSADATLIAPAGPAFSIWSAIYLGLVGYVVWQFLPAQKASKRHRLLGYPIAASLILNAAWLLTVQAALLPLSIVVIVLLLAVLAWTFVICLRERRQGWAEAILVDGVVGLYLGWVCVATAANIAAVLVASGFTGWGIDPDVWAAVVIAVAGAVGVALAVYGRGRLSPAASLSWGLAWVAVSRIAGELTSTPTAVAAIIAAIVVVVVTVVIRLRSGRARG